MAISYVGGASGITSATLPAHQVGDLIIAFAFRDGSTVIPSLGSGFTSSTTRVGTLSSCIVGFRRATVTNTASGTWTNATSVIFLIYRDVASIGGNAVNSGTSTTISYPAVTLTNQIGSSWVVGFAGHASNNVAIETAPTGMVNRVSVSDSTDEAAAHDTNSGLTSFTARTASVGGSSSNWVSATVELIDGSAVANLTGIETTTSLDNFSFISTNWWQFFFEYGLPLDSFVTSDWHAFFFERGIYLEAIGRANKELVGIESITTTASITAIGQNNAIQTLEGIELLSSFSTLTVSVDDLEAINSIELISSIGEITTTADGYYLQSGFTVNSNYSDISAFGNANYQEFGIEAEFANSEVAVLADSLVELSGLGLLINYGTIVVTGTSNVSVIIGGISLVSELKNVTAFAGNNVNAAITVAGLEATSLIGSVTAKIESPVTFAGGRVKRYPANAFKNSVVKILGITANFSQNAVIAVGTTQINATIMLDNVVSFTQIANINAEGVLSINEEELILLMAA